MRSLEADKHPLGLSSDSPWARAGSLLRAWTHFTLSATALCLLTSCFLHTGSSLGVISGQGLAQPAHLPEAHKCGAVNTLGDNFPPMQGGRQMFKCFCHPSFQRLILGAILQACQSVQEKLSPSPYTDLDYACFCSFLLLFRLTRLPLSHDLWGHFPKELCMREVLISGSALLIHCFMQSIFVLLLPANAWISTGKFAGSGPGI